MRIRTRRHPIQLFKTTGKIPGIGKSGVINLPSTNAYANEIRYFADCVLNNTPIEKVTADQLETVLQYLHEI